MCFHMLDFITKYWIEFLFGLIVSGMGIFFKHYLKLLKNEQKNEKNEFLKIIKKEISAEFSKALDNEQNLQKQIDDLNKNSMCLQKGILSLQRRTFEEDCKELLHEYHDISLEEYEQLTEDHDIYKKLGGNHNGDKLYELVMKKVENTLTAHE